MVKINTTLSSCLKMTTAPTNHPVHPEPTGTRESRCLSSHHQGPVWNRKEQQQPFKFLVHKWEEPLALMKPRLRYIRKGWFETEPSPAAQPLRKRTSGFGHSYPRRKAHGTPIFKQALFARGSSRLWAKNFPLETQRSVFFLVMELILKKKKC